MAQPQPQPQPQPPDSPLREASAALRLNTENIAPLQQQGQTAGGNDDAVSAETADFGHRRRRRGASISAFDIEEPVDQFAPASRGSITRRHVLSRISCGSATTDTVFIVIVACVSLWWILTVGLSKYFGPATLAPTLDFTGRFCGHAELEQSPMLWVPTKPTVAAGGLNSVTALDFERAMCVPDCPTLDDAVKHDDIGHLFSAIAVQYGRELASTKVYPSEPFGSIVCVPDHGDLGAEFAQILRLDSHRISAWLIMEQLSCRSGILISVSLVIVTLGCALCLWGTLIKPEITLVLSVGSVGILALVSLFVFPGRRQFPPTSIGFASRSLGYINHSWMVPVFACVTLSGVCALFVSAIFSFRKRLRLSTVILKTSQDAIRAVPIMLAVPFSAAALVAVLSLFTVRRLWSMAAPHRLANPLQPSAFSGFEPPTSRTTYLGGRRLLTAVSGQDEGAAELQRLTGSVLDRAWQPQRPASSFDIVMHRDNFVTPAAAVGQWQAVTDVQDYDNLNRPNILADVPVAETYPLPQFDQILKAAVDDENSITSVAYHKYPRQPADIAFYEISDDAKEAQRQLQRAEIDTRLTVPQKLQASGDENSGDRQRPFDGVQASGHRFPIGLENMLQPETAAADELDADDVHFQDRVGQNIPEFPSSPQSMRLPPATSHGGADAETGAPRMFGHPDRRELPLRLQADETVEKPQLDLDEDGGSGEQQSEPRFQPQPLPALPVPDPGQTQDTVHSAIVLPDAVEDSRARLVAESPLYLSPLATASSIARVLSFGLSSLFLIETVLALSQFMIAACVCVWYFTVPDLRGQRDINYKDMRDAQGRVFTLYLGSIGLVACLNCVFRFHVIAMSVVPFIPWLSRMTESQIRQDSWAGKALKVGKVMMSSVSGTTITECLLSGCDLIDGAQSVLDRSQKDKAITKLLNFGPTMVAVTVSVIAGVVASMISILMTDKIPLYSNPQSPWFIYSPFVTASVAGYLTFYTVLALTSAVSQCSETIIACYRLERTDKQNALICTPDNLSITASQIQTAAVSMAHEEAATDDGSLSPHLQRQSIDSIYSQWTAQISSGPSIPAAAVPYVAVRPIPSPRPGARYTSDDLYDTGDGGLSFGGAAETVPSIGGDAEAKFLTRSPWLDPVAPVASATSVSGPSRPPNGSPAQGNPESAVIQHRD